VFGVGVAVGIGSGLAIALGLNFLWILVTFEIDDGEVDSRVGESGIRDDAEHHGQQ
jgi:hypothetical protein